MELKEIYKQLTGVDIEEQKRIWNERGKGYYGEFLLFCELYRHIAGTGKILMNLNIPVNDMQTTEIDLLLIHETGFYVFEIKHYKGTIYGKDTDDTWTQYFRTVRNNRFRNPVKQNDYHVNALQKLFSDIPIYSIIVFTSDDCDIRINNTNPRIDICLLNGVQSILSRRFQQTKHKNMSMEEIDHLFDRLSVYSQMQKTVTIGGVEASFFSWVQPTVSKLENKVTEVEQEKRQWAFHTEELKTAKRKGKFANIAVAVLCVMATVVFVVIFQKGYDAAIQKNDAELASFKQNFLHIDEIDNEYIDTLNSYIDVSNIALSPLTDDAVSFKATLTMLNDTYGIVIRGDAKYIVMTDSGKVFEYDLFDGSYWAYSNIMGSGYRMSLDLTQAQFYGISDPNEVSYIKLKNVQLIRLDINQTVIKDDLEIELYIR